MKSLLSTIALSILFFSSFAQCPSPVVEDWYYNEVENKFFVSVSSSPEAEIYILRVFRQYDNFTYTGDFDQITDSITVAGASQVIEIDASLLFSGNPFNPDPYWYYAVDLSSICANGEQSAITPFYISALSLLNDPGFNCNGNFFNPRTYLADGAGFAFDVYLSIPASVPTESIDSLEVFIDLGHTFLGDLSIALESPWGAEIDLLSWPNMEGSTNNMSVLFRDGGSSFNSLPGGGAIGISGIAAPSQPLSTFAGQPSEGVWILRIRDHLASDFGFVYGICMSINGSPCDATVLGSVYYDLNDNGSFDGSDQPLPYPWLLNTADNDLFNGNSGGNYIDCTQPGASTIALQNTPNNYTSQAAPFNAESGGTAPGVDLPLSPIPDIYDICLDWFTADVIRPGFETTFIAHITNAGTECVDGATFFFELPEFVQVVFSNPVGATIGSSSGQLSVPTICPLEQLSFTITFEVDDTVAIGELFSSTANVQIGETDSHPENNQSTLNDVVVGAYDPNDKQVSNELINTWFVENNEPLKYTVRFQNTGNYAAERVLIADTLDADLDMSTFLFISASHNMELTFNGNIAYFEFDQIFLPDSAADLEGSQGYVRYSIEPQANFGVNMEIENTAYIFFDFNVPIITNTVVTGFGEALSTSDFDLSANVFPNPAKDQLRVTWKSTAGVERIDVFDMRGRLVQSQNIGFGVSMADLNVSELGQGVYVARLVSDQGMASAKFTILK